MSNIHTLTENKKTFKIKKKSVAPVATFPKPSGFEESLHYYTQMAEQHPNIELRPIFLERGEKRPVKGILHATSHHPDKRWNTDKLTKWVKNKKYERVDCDLGVQVGDGLGVLDFDCQQDYAWFKKQFNFNERDYLVVQGQSKNHGCGCKTETEQSTHVYFLNDNLDKGGKVKCIYKNTETKEERKIDYITVTGTGTAHILKVPNGESGVGCKQIINKVEQFKTLPNDIVMYFKSMWVPPPKSDVRTEPQDNKYIKLTKLIKNVGVKEYCKIIKELKGQGIANDVIISNTLHFRVNGRVGPGSKKYNLEEHKTWTNQIISQYDAHQTRDNAFLIVKMAKDCDSDRAKDIHIKGLRKFGKRFNIQKIRDIANYEGNIDDRAISIQKYYNHFIKVCNNYNGKSTVLQIDYDNEGIISDVRPLCSKAEFYDGHFSAKMVLPGAEKAQDSAKWYKYQVKPYDKIIYKPFGVGSHIHQNPETFNLFPGFAQKYISNYDKPADNFMGDRINNHLYEVICSENTELYNFHRKLLHSLIVEGKRPRVMIVNYSQEKGIGKNLWTDGVAKFLVGKGLTSHVSSFAKMTKDTFTSQYLDNKSLITLEELPEYSSTAKEAWDLMKNIITEETMVGRGAYEAPKSQDNYFMIIANTNHPYSVPEEVIDRRAVVNRCSAKYLGNTSYFSAVAKSSCRAGWDNFFHRYILDDTDFADVDILPNSKTIPQTPYRNEILSKSQDTVLQFLRELYNDNIDSFTGDKPVCVYLKDLSNRYSNWCRQNSYEIYFKNDADFKKKLELKLEIAVQQIKTEDKGAKIFKRRNMGWGLVFTPAIIKSLEKKWALSDKCSFILDDEVVALKEQTFVNDDDELD